MREPSFIPLICPYTKEVVFDENGYRESFPSTLIYANLGGEPMFIMKNLSVLVEISDRLSTIGKDRQKRIVEKYNWLNQIEILSTVEDLLSVHPLIESKRDENNPDYGLEFSFYFSLPINHQQILQDFYDLANDIK